MIIDLKNNEARLVSGGDNNCTSVAASFARYSFESACTIILSIIPVNKAFADRKHSLTFINSILVPTEAAIISLCSCSAGLVSDAVYNIQCGSNKAESTSESKKADL